MPDKPRLLIVDDEPIGRETLGEMLMMQGYEIHFAGTGSEALERVKTIVLDLILLDVMMPGMDGFEVCRQLKAHQNWRHIPVILVTALDSKSDMIRGIDAGAEDFLHKPVNTLELRARVRSMLRIKRQYDELQSTLQLREDMANMIVHDMRTPLSAIMAISELLYAGEFTMEELPEDIETIYQNALRLNTFTNDMLMLAKVKANELILHRAKTDFGQLVGLVKRSHAITARLKKIDLRVTYVTSAKCLVDLDATLMQRVLDNLISNALKFSPPEGVVALEIDHPRARMSDHPNQPQLRLRVIDQGPGVPAEHQDHIFGKFQVVDLKQSNISQVGLGLAFCKIVVEAHAGRIFVEDNDPQGAIFTVEI